MINFAPALNPLEDISTRTRFELLLTSLIFFRNG